MHNVLITGGAGFIGHHLVKRLLQEHNWKITIIDNLSNGDISNLNLQSDKMKFYLEDIRNGSVISDIVQKESIDTCIHLAAKISVVDSLVDPFDTADVNVRGTLSMLDACSKNDVNKFVFASSAAVYGQPKTLPLREEYVLQPLSPYGASKVAGEAFVSSYGNSRKIQNTISLRFFNIFGEAQSREYAGVITKFSERLSKRLPPIIYGDGGQIRDFVFVDDVVQAILLATETEVTDVFNVGTGKPTSINDLAQLMIRLFRLDLQPIYDEANNGDVTLSLADIEKASNLLRFNAKEDLESGLKRILGPC